MSFVKFKEFASSDSSVLGPCITISIHPTLNVAALVENDSRSISIQALELSSPSSSSSPSVSRATFSLPEGAPSYCVTWRPCHPRTLAVGSSLGRIFLIELDERCQPSTAPKVLQLSGPAALMSPTVHNLEFSPNGLTLAASGAFSGFVVVDVAFLGCTLLSAGRVERLRFSPSGAHLVSAARGSGAVTLWETAGWTSASWAGAGDLTSCEWTGDSEKLMLHFRGARGLQYLHLKGDGTGLDAQVRAKSRFAVE